MTHFISFGGPSLGYYRAVNRISHEAVSLNIFSTVKGFTDKDLKEDKDFWKNHGTFVENNKRGYGYWLWKPYIVKKTLDHMKEGEILFYADAGCKFNVGHPVKDLLDKFDHMRKTKKIIRGCTCPEVYWTKMDLVKLLKMETHPKLKGPQYCATAFMLIKTPEIVNVINEWWNISIRDNYHYINNSPSISKNHAGFKEHRHDQSIFSLLVKKHNIYSNLNVRGRNTIFDTPRYRAGPNYDGGHDVTNIVKKYIINNKLHIINKRYNAIFSDIAKNEPKELIIIYQNTDNKLITTAFNENTTININDLLKLESCKYNSKSKQNNVKCLINV
jgi:hypothetical protein